MDNRYLTFEKLEKYVLTSNSNYWKEGYKYRWKYMSYAIEQMKKMNINEAIESGAMGLPLKENSYLFNLPWHDLNKIPYKTDEGFEFKEKVFDCFIALQVWEHIDKQAEAFQEVERISKAAILSFPYRWKHGDRRHRNITDEKIAEWTCHRKPKDIKLIDTRIIYTWVF